MFPEKIEKSGVFREGLLLTSKWAALRTPRGLLVVVGEIQKS